MKNSQRNVIFDSPPAAPSEEEARAFMRAADFGDRAGVMEFLDKYPDQIDVKNSNGMTALMFAAAWGHADIAALLLEKGADVDQQDWSGERALMYAAHNGRTGVVQVLLEKGADIDALNNTSQTALERAQQSGHKDTAALLKAWPKKQKVLALEAEFRSFSPALKSAMPYRGPLRFKNPGF